MNSFAVFLLHFMLEHNQYICASILYILVMKFGFFKTYFNQMSAFKLITFFQSKCFYNIQQKIETLNKTVRTTEICFHFRVVNLYSYTIYIYRFFWSLSYVSCWQMHENSTTFFGTMTTTEMSCMNII